jgi:hypothetical protein
VSARGLSGVVRANGMTFENNYALERIEGFDSLEHLNYVTLRGNSQLSMFELPNTLTEGVEMMLIGNPALTSMEGFKNLKTMMSNLFIVGMGFEDLSLLGALESVQSVHIEENSKLVSFAGFEHVKSISGLFNVRQNNLLEDIDALEALEEIRGDIVIEANQNLTQCEITEALEGVSIPAGTTFENSPPCTPNP